VQSVAWTGAGEPKATIQLKVRALYVDSKFKEYTVGPPRDITDRLFVVRRAFRVNDALPGEEKARWRWERGGWLSVDRSTGRVSQLSLPAFDPYYSAAVWYRDYVAYCGTSGDRSKVYAVVWQMGRRRHLFRQVLAGSGLGSAPDSACPSPVWERDPARVTFELNGGQKLTFSIGERQAETVAEETTNTPE
jgi:hypothetical protein